MRNAAMQHLPLYVMSPRGSARPTDHIEAARVGVTTIERLLTPHTSIRDVRVKRETRGKISKVMRALRVAQMPYDSLASMNRVNSILVMAGSGADRRRWLIV